MPFYNDLRPEADFATRDFVRVFPEMTTTERARCIDGLRRLKAGLAQHVPPRETEGNLLVASWNIVALGGGDYRDGEGLYYVAEIIGAFDLIAVQELKPNLTDLDKLMRILGPHWSYMVNDPTGGDAGNDERSAYVFNTNRVRLSGVAGELSLWQDYDGDWPGAMRSLKRPPYMTGFVTAWKHFAMVNLHLHPGKDRAQPDADPPVPSDAQVRQEEIRLLLAVLAARREQLWSKNLILVGDTNFYRRHDEATLDLLHAAGFWESGGLVGKTTNITVDPADGETYDRMFFNGEEYFDIAVRDGLEQGGVFDFLDHVYRDADWPTYREAMRDKRTKAADKSKMMTDDAAAWRYFRDTYRKRQVSDHFPIWVELSVDDSDAFLARNRAAIAAT